MRIRYEGFASSALMTGWKTTEDHGVPWTKTRGFNCDWFDAVMLLDLARLYRIFQPWKWNVKGDGDVRINHIRTLLGRVLCYMGFWKFKIGFYSMTMDCQQQGVPY